MSVQINGTNGLTFNDGSSQQTAASGFGFKNRIINGAMMIDQRNAGASVTSGTSTYGLDRWITEEVTDGSFTVQPVSEAPAGFNNSLKITVTSADTSLGASQFAKLEQRIEGYNMADFGWGTANAQAATLSFKVRSSLTGTFGGCFQNQSGTRSYPFTYTISAADTWVTKSVTVAGDTTGTWLTTNGIGLKVTFGLGVGSSLSGTAGAWASAELMSVTGAESVIGTNGATFYITGVQLEKGSTATSFDYRPYGTELALCQRYFSSSFIIGTAPADNVGNSVLTTFTAYDTTTGWIPWIAFPVTMRSSPTVTTYRTDAGSTNGQWATYDGSYTSFTSSQPTVTTNGFMISGTRSSAFAQYRSYPCRGNYTASAEL